MSAPPNCWNRLPPNWAMPLGTASPKPNVNSVNHLTEKLRFIATSALEPDRTRLRSSSSIVALRNRGRSSASKHRVRPSDHCIALVGEVGPKQHPDLRGPSKNKGAASLQPVV